MSRQAWFYTILGIVLVIVALALALNHKTLQVSFENSWAKVQNYQACVNSCQQEFSSCQQSARSPGPGAPGQRGFRSAAPTVAACSDRYDSCLSQCQVQQVASFSPGPPAAPSQAPVPIPQYYVNNQPTTTITCGQTFTFQIDNYTPTQVWLTRYKDNASAPDVDGPLTVPLTYQTVCHQDEGTYRADLYILANGAKGSLLGSVTATIKAAAGTPPLLPNNPNESVIQLLKQAESLQEAYDIATAYNLKAEFYPGDFSALLIYDESGQTLLAALGEIASQLVGSAADEANKAQLAVCLTTPRGASVNVIKGKVVGIGSADFSVKKVNCGTLSQSKCSTVLNQLGGVEQQFNALPDGPHYSNTAPVGINIVFKGNLVGDAAGLSMPGSFNSSGGTYENTCNIYLSQSQLKNQPPDIIGLVIEHEMLHCFGIGHDSGGLMSSTLNLALATGPGGIPIPDNIAKVLSDLKNNRDITVAYCTQPESCPTNQTPNLNVYPPRCVAAGNCSPGETLQNGRCVPAPCPSGQHMNPDTNLCEPTCAPNQTFNPVTNRCEQTCLPPQVLDSATGRCVEPAPSCHIDSEGVAVCECTGGITCKFINNNWVCHNDSGYLTSNACMSYGAWSGGGSSAGGGSGLSSFLQWLQGICTESMGSECSVQSMFGW